MSGAPQGQQTHQTQQATELGSQQAPAQQAQQTQAQQEMLDSRQVTYRQLTALAEHAEQQGADSLFSRVEFSWNGVPWDDDRAKNVINRMLEKYANVQR